MKAVSAVTVVVAVLGLGLLWSGSAGAAEKFDLSARKVAKGPKIDGKIDKQWNKAKRSKIVIPGKFTVEAKALYTPSDIYFLFRWPDKTKSLNRVYVYKNGGWKKKKGSEDRFNLLWNVNNSIKGFQEKGCKVACHEKKDEEGSMGTNGPSEIGDLWHWKAQRTNPAGYADDQHLVHELKQSGHELTGRRSDKKSGGGYAKNWDKAKNRPLFTFARGKGGPILFKAMAKAVGDATSFKAGMVVPREVLEKPGGSRGDVAAKGIWKKGKWTLELKRARNTGHDDDIQFDDPGATYYFGLSVHNNSGEDNHATSGVVRLKFKK